MNQKLFIVFEGIDSCGKSTQAELLKNYLITQKEQAVISPEPSTGIIGNLIRQALKQRVVFTSDRSLFEEQMAYLFAADRHDHLYNDIDGVFKLIKDRVHVISTRYYFSSLAYNSDTPKQFELVSSLNQRFPHPDLTVYIDVPLEVSLNRLQERPLKEVYETRAKLTKVREQYQRIFASYEGVLLNVDGTQNKQDIHEDIVKFIHDKFT